MATPILIIGKSGTGKSTSLRNCVENDDWNLIRVLNKPLPFKGKINGWSTDDYQTVMKCLAGSKANNIVIDEKGKLNGRGAYLKKDLSVIEKAKKNKILNKVLEVEVPDSIFVELEEKLK